MISSYVSFAASFPASRLFVEALALIAPAGASGTPESKPIIGMPASIAVWIEPKLACVSSAAKHIAAGFCAIAASKYSICCAIADSLSGPWNVTSTPKSVPACIAPFSTAFQN